MIPVLPVEEAHWSRRVRNGVFCGVHPKFGLELIQPITLSVVEIAYNFRGTNMYLLLQ